jgi:hypothetical protein
VLPVLGFQQELQKKFISFSFIIQGGNMQERGKEQNVLRGNKGGSFSDRMSS